MLYAHFGGNSVEIDGFNVHVFRERARQDASQFKRYYNPIRITPILDGESTLTSVFENERWIVL